MILKPIPEEEIVNKSKKIDSKKVIIQSKYVVSEDKKHVISTEEIVHKKDMVNGVTNVIVKMIYFPGNLYSQNKDKFKKVLTEFGLLWAKSSMRTHTNKEGKSLMSGIYYSPDQIHKILAIYEGTDKPATFFYKTTGSGGLFLLNLIQFCTTLGCVIEDKNDEYMQKVVMQLDSYGDINVEEKKEYAQLSDFEKKAFDEKVKKVIDETLDKYIADCGESFQKRGISVETVKFFKRKDLEQSVPWAIEHGFIKI